MLGQTGVKAKGENMRNLIIAAGAAALLWYVVFPWADPYLPFNDVTVDGGEAVYGTTPEGAAEPDEGG